MMCSSDVWTSRATGSVTAAMQTGWRGLTAFTYARDYFGNILLLWSTMMDATKIIRRALSLLIIVRRYHGMKKNKTTNHLFPFSIACYINIIYQLYSLHTTTKGWTRPSKKSSQIPPIHRTTRTWTSGCLRNRPSSPSWCYRMLSKGGGQSLWKL